MVVHFRYYLMQKAKAAATVGILVGTLATGNDIIMTSSSLSYSIDGYREIIDRLKTLLTLAGKKV